MSKRCQFIAEVGIIENLAVERNDQIVALHRLSAERREIDDRQARMRQGAMRITPTPAAVGSAPIETRQCRTETRFRCFRRKSREINEAGDTAHRNVSARPSARDTAAGK
jgi:hypothetical protein